MLILMVMIFSRGRSGYWSWRIILLIFLVSSLQSCGITGSDTEVKEKRVGSGETGAAYKKEAVTMNEARGVKTEIATFALG
jgi:hypothetical protein